MLVYIGHPRGCSFCIKSKQEKGGSHEMSEGIIITLITLGGSGFGSLVGILVSSRLTTYRLEQLEKKVDKHNTVIERTFKLEERCTLYEEKFKVTNHRLDDLEKEVVD
jgi:hypothetical protein